MTLPLSASITNRASARSGAAPARAVSAMAKPPGNNASTSALRSPWVTSGDQDADLGGDLGGVWDNGIGKINTICGPVSLAPGTNSRRQILADASRLTQRARRVATSIIGIRARNATSGSVYQDNVEEKGKN